MLAVEVRCFVSEREPVPTDTFEEYDKNGVAPTAIHQDKTAYKESLQLLLDGILESIDHTPVQEAT